VSRNAWIFLALAGLGLASYAIYRAATTEVLPGGAASGRKPSDFNATELRRGTEHELEHTADHRIAREIAMDHLAEDPLYYQKLERLFH
jgi:hypothetical protein